MRNQPSAELTDTQLLFLSALRTHLAVQMPPAASSDNRSESDKPAAAPDRQELAAVFSLAMSHKVLPLVYEGLYTAGLLSAFDDADLEEYRRAVYRDVIGQTGRTRAFLGLYGELCRRGIRPLVMKGIVCRSFYPRADHRPSADEDLLIPPARFAECEAALYALGASEVRADGTNRASEDIDSSPAEIPQERSYVFPRGLYIELHTALFSGDDGISAADMERLFPDPFNAPASVFAENTEILTLSPEKHLLYLLLHAYKHFVHAGFGIRQVCDIALFAVRYQDEIDFAKLYRSCESVRAQRFASAVFAIAQNYLGIPCPQAAEIWKEAAADIDCVPLLCDILSGGIYGGTEGSRLHSTTITLDAARRGKHAKTSVLRSLFPPVSALKSRYPFLQKHPYLLPAAWVRRMAAYAGETFGKGKSNSAKESMRIASERIRLLAYYDIIDT
ncbi:MAG: nucleotidyltransferase family protein [Eubacteriales bacterium]